MNSAEKSRAEPSMVVFFQFGVYSIQFTLFCRSLTNPAYAYLFSLSLFLYRIGAHKAFSMVFQQHLLLILCGSFVRSLDSFRILYILVGFIMVDWTERDAASVCMCSLLIALFFYYALFNSAIVVGCVFTLVFHDNHRLVGGVCCSSNPYI